MPTVGGVSPTEAPGRQQPERGVGLVHGVMGHSSLWWLVVVGLFVLFALLVVVAVAVNTQFAALAGRIAVLEAGGSCLVLVGSPPADVVLCIHAAAKP